MENNTKKTINEMKVKICDRYPVESKFEFDEELVIFLKGSIVKKSILNNQDGTVDLVLVFKASDHSIERKDNYYPETKTEIAMDNKIKGLLKIPE